MRFFPRRAISAALLATTAFAATACSDTQDDSASPALTTVETSAAETSTQSSTSEQPSSTSKDAAPSDEKKDEADKKNDSKDDDTKKEDKPEKDDNKVDMASAPSGTHCGEISNNGNPLLVIAIADGADCTTGTEMAKTYLSPNPPGTMHPGSATIWESPDGWVCSARVIPPGFNDEPGHRKIGCGPNASDRTVIAMSPDEAPTYGL
mgnify:CR=1 FL=1